MAIEMLHDNILVSVQPRKEKTESGIILPDTVGDSEILQGVVENFSVDGKKSEYSGEYGNITEFECGNTILFKKQNSFELKMHDKMYRVVKYGDVIAVVL